MKILVVDDDALNLKVAEGYLRDKFPGYPVKLCQEPDKVMGILESENIDIILLDIMMPVISGTDLLKDIRKKREYKDIQILMLTAITDTESLKTCFELGANDYLTKPIDILEFQARINAAANIRSNALIIQELFSKMKAQNTELKEMNDKLIETQSYFVQFEKLMTVDRISAGVAHEIRNPMDFIQNRLVRISDYFAKINQFTDDTMKLLNDMKNDPYTNHPEDVYDLIKDKYVGTNLNITSLEIGGVIEDSKEGIHKIAQILKSLKDFSSRDNESDKNHYMVNEIMEQIFFILRSKSKGIAEIDYDNLNLIKVYCNKEQMGQVLLNIIVNSIEAIKTQNRIDLGKITISAYNDEKSSCISIKDDGPGIDEEKLSQFYSPIVKDEKNPPNIAVGLSVSNDIIVNKHGGKLEVFSRQGEGTQFIIKLPMK